MKEIPDVSSPPSNEMISCGSSGSSKTPEPSDEEVGSPSSMV